jgi:uncharacterized damage-inducible protein DinB
MIGHYRAMLAYEQWANERALASLLSVPSGGRNSPAFARASGLLPHIAFARLLWLDRIHGRPPGLPKDWFEAMDEGATRSLLARADAAWREFLSGVGAEGLAREIAYRAVDGTAYRSTIGDICTHVFNHGTYHRGQLARLVSECGGERAVTDFVAMTRVEGS